MELTTKQEMAQNVMNDIIVKCWEDDNFKSQLIADPITTIEKFTGNIVNIPQGKKIIVQDQSKDPNAVYINIPAEPNLDELELSDEQLELVAGGVTPASPAVASYFIVFGAGVAVGSYLFGGQPGQDGQPG